MSGESELSADYYILALDFWVSKDRDWSFIVDEGSICTDVMIRMSINFAELVKEKLGLSYENEDVKFSYHVPSWLTDDIHGNLPTTIETNGDVFGYFILCREIVQVNLCVPIS